MKEKLNTIQDQVGTLVNWVSDMKTIVENPYSNGLNIQRVLEDLGGFAATLTRSISEVQEMAAQAEKPEIEEKQEPEKEKSTSK